MSSLTHRSTGAVSGGFGTSLTPGAPSGLANGDLMFLFTVQRASSETQDTALTGWTQIYFHNAAGGSVAIYAHIADSVNDAPSPNWSGGSWSSAFLVAFTGDLWRNLATMLESSDEATPSQQNIGFDAFTAPAINNCLLIGYGKKNSTAGDATDLVPGSEFTQIAEELDASGGRHHSVIGIWQQTTAAAYDGDDWTVDGTSEAIATIGAIIAIKTIAIDSVSTDDVVPDDEAPWNIAGTGFGAD